MSQQIGNLTKENLVFEEERNNAIFSTSCKKSNNEGTNF